MGDESGERQGDRGDRGDRGGGGSGLEGAEAPRPPAWRWRDLPTGFVIDDSPVAPAPPGLEAALGRALEAMVALEAGAVANPDEGRQVGHYWLRSPELAPDNLGAEIEAVWARLEDLERGPHEDLLLIGIGGSALGPQLLAHALARRGDPMRLHFLDNTDPEGISTVLDGLDPRRTLVLVVSKSGGTVETHNGMLAAMARWAAAGEPFEPHAIAITMEGSVLDRLASGASGTPPWRDRLPLWDWVGGRTSLCSAVGLLPMALCGWDWRAFIAGAREMDALGRQALVQNPAARLAAAWYREGRGRGERNLVIEPYRDRFLLLGRYLQQLVMESIGKELDREGRTVHQGLLVYGNKGSTDQHAFIQQVRDGRDDSLVIFVETDECGPELRVGPDLLAGDHLLGFLYGTRAALEEAGRPSLTLQVPDVSARSLGMLVALFERAVGIYAELVGINAYHQPGVEAGKKGAKRIVAALGQLQELLGEDLRETDFFARSTGLEVGLAWRLLSHLVATGRARSLRSAEWAEDRFSRA
jgi:glucose-6-phosphate isomerase